MFGIRRWFVHCCALMLVLALLVSGCGGTGSGDPGTGSGAPGAGSSGAATGPGTSSPGQGGQPGQSGGSGQTDDPGQESGADGGEAAPFQLSDWELLGMYEVFSRFQALAFAMTLSAADEVSQVSIDIRFNGTGDLSGTAVERYQYTLAGVGESGEGDDTIEMWFDPGGTLVAVQNISAGDAEVVTDPFALGLMELGSVWILLPFQSAHRLLADANEDEVSFTNTQFSTETVAGHRVTVGTFTGTAPDERGVIRPFAMRIARLGGLPFLLEMDADGETVFVTPTSVELR